jgi:hypothetical protein
MGNDVTLVPDFIPPLARMLAAAEQKKGSPLTQQEVETVRDESVCIMMTPADSRAINQSRGWIDVNPENCWVDWHRLRPQMSGAYLPRVILCLPGDDDFRSRAEPILQAENVEHEFREHEPNLLRSFETSSMTRPWLTPDDIARIGGHRCVLYVLSGSIVPAEAGSVSQRFLKLGRRLLDGGGFGVKCDSAGISHSPSRWAHFDDAADRRGGYLWWALFDAYMAYPIGDAGGDLYTCGMHLLGAPDLIVSAPTLAGLIGPEKPVVSAAAELFRVFGVYLVGECPTGKFASGHTFSLNAQSPRYRVVWEPCTGYDEDDYFFNPFGRWRFTSP